MPTKNDNKATVGTLTNEVNLLKNRLKQLENANEKLVNEKNDLVSRVERLESFRETSTNVTKHLKEENDRLKAQLDNVDQYGRRSNLIIKHVTRTDTEKDDPNELQQKVTDFLSKELKLPNAAKDIDKLHRTGKPKTYNGATQQNIIVRFKTHATRYAVYRKRNQSKKFKICPNLTKHREKTLHEAKEAASKIDEVDFVYADIHGDLKIRFKTKMEDSEVHRFSDLNDLADMLKRFGFVEEDTEEDAE